MVRTIQPRPGAQLVEVAVASVVVAVMLVCSLDLLGASLRGSAVTSRMAQADKLAESLMAETEELPFDSPAPDLIPKRRRDFRKLADFNGWSASPPVDRDGNEVADKAWQRTVSIELADPLNLNPQFSGPGQEASAVQVTVKVEHNGKTVKTLTGLRVKSWDDSIRLGNESGRHVDVSNQPPHIDVAQAGPLTGQSPLTVTFDVSNTFDPEGDSLTFAWEFGDSSGGSGSSITHKYTNSSNEPQTVSTLLTVTDSRGASTQKTFHVHLDFE